MAKVVHRLDDHGKSLCGTQPRSKRKGTGCDALVTCRNCMKRMTPEAAARAFRVASRNAYWLNPR